MKIVFCSLLRFLRDLRGLRKEKGIALMLVLWILTLLSVMVLEFCYTMRLEATITKNFKEGARSYYLAQAGINRAIIEIVKTKSSVKKFKGSRESLVKDKEQDETGEEEESKEWRPREEPYAFPFGDGKCEVKIGDEGSKINLNWVATEAKKKRKLLTDILEKSCGLEGEERDIIADSIIDWVDKDHAHLLNGAEDDYYESLEDSYECRDGKFVVTDELLLVRGVTEEIYYGRRSPAGEGDEVMEEERAVMSLLPDGKMGEGSEGRRRIAKGLSEIFTVFSNKKSLKININDAPYELLMTVPGMADEVALRIIEMRREEEFENINDARLKELPNYNQIAPSITVDPSNFYRIEARGKIADSSVKRAITAVIELTMKKRDKYKILYWQEGV